MKRISLYLRKNEVNEELFAYLSRFHVDNLKLDTRISYVSVHKCILIGKKPFNQKLQLYGF